MNYTNCQSCGMPLKKDGSLNGTNQDGSKSHLYCSHCFVNGTFSLPSISVIEMKDRVKGKLKEFGIPGFLTGLFTRNIHKLERWRK